MPKKNQHIHVNTLPSGTREGIVIGRNTINGSPNFAAVERAHRDNGHLFILQEKGKTHIEIDFKTHQITERSVIYIHPSQIHRLISFENATVTTWIITSENLQAEYINLLEDLKPVDAVLLSQDSFDIICKAANLCVEVVEHKQQKLYENILKQGCNTLVALIVSEYLAQVKPAEHSSRFELVTKAFKTSLEKNFSTIKSPSAYAALLNVSAPYLNECVKTATGQAVTFHIQQRVILEAKRMLFHSDQSVKEIAGVLGYDDFSYFTRLFTKTVGTTPLVFRSKNLE